MAYGSGSQTVVHIYIPLVITGFHWTVSAIEVYFGPGFAQI